MQWAGRRIVARDFTNVQLFAADLLDTYMEYKNNLIIIQNILVSPTGYKLGPGNRPVNVSVVDLVEERKKMKKEMRKIIQLIDKLYVSVAISRARGFLILVSQKFGSFDPQRN